MSWIDLEPTEFKFKKDGDNLVGRLLGAKETQFGSKAYDLEDANGNKYYFFGCAQLDRLLADRLYQIVSITYRGTKPIKGGRTMKVFDVRSWKSENGTLPEGFQEALPY